MNNCYMRQEYRNIKHNSSSFLVHQLMVQSEEQSGCLENHQVVLAWRDWIQFKNSISNAEDSWKEAIREHKGIPDNRVKKDWMRFIRDSKAGETPQHMPSLCGQGGSSVKMQINLKDMPSQTEVKLVEREIKLHSELDHPHIIKLWDTLLDDDKIYMIMEYAEQGNLFYHQNTKNIYSEPEAFKFFTQTLQGIHYLHSNNIIHRDLKPENLLLDAHSNIKICDFGWCAEDIRAKRTTFCGTYEYMAPQMLFKSEYDYRVDIWAMGVLLYQMLHGHAPFKGKSATEVQEAMLRGSYQIGPQLTEPVKALISSILQFQPEKRPSMEEIFKHPWIKDMEHYLNNYLKLQNVILPKDVHPKIATIPPMTVFSKPKMTSPAKHRKNNSLNIDESGHNININLQINNFAIVGKHGSKNKYHSQQKDRQLEEYTNFKDAFESYQTTNVRKSKMEPVCKTQITELDMHRMIDRMKSTKTTKITKDIPSFERQKKKPEGPLHDTINKKKFKLRKSQVDLFEKQNPVRFNTQANEKQDWEPCKLKKSHLKSKLLQNSKSITRLGGKSSKIE